MSVSPVVSESTLRTVERAAGGVATRAVALMDERLPWFRTLPAEQRSWVTLVAQAGISGYVAWMANPGAGSRITEQVFSTAPRDLVRSVSLRRTVELVRVAISVAEDHLPALADSPAERAALADSLLRYSREVAFAAAGVYAAAAETRGAWDARTESALVDGIVRGEDVVHLASRAAALNWDATAPSRVLAGAAPDGDPGSVLNRVADWVRANRRFALAGIHGTRLVVVLSPADRPGDDVTTLFGAGPVVIGPPLAGLEGAIESAAEALAALAVGAAWPTAPRPVDAEELLAERALAGDRRAIHQLRAAVFAPLAADPGALLATLDAYLAAGAALEPTARRLFVHPNTVRYRLHKIGDLTGRDPGMSTTG